MSTISSPRRNYLRLSSITCSIVIRSTFVKGSQGLSESLCMSPTRSFALTIAISIVHLNMCQFYSFYGSQTTFQLLSASKVISLSLSRQTYVRHEIQILTELFTFTTFETNFAHVEMFEVRFVQTLRSWL